MDNYKRKKSKEKCDTIYQKIHSGMKKLSIKDRITETIHNILLITTYLIIALAYLMLLMLIISPGDNSIQFLDM